MSMKFEQTLRGLKWAFYLDIADREELLLWLNSHPQLNFHELGELKAAGVKDSNVSRQDKLQELYDYTTIDKDGNVKIEI